MQKDSPQLDTNVPDDANSTAAGSVNIKGDDSVDEAAILTTEAPFKGNELDEADFGDNTDISGDELDDDKGGQHTDNPISGNELGDDVASTVAESASRVGMSDKNQASRADETEALDQNSDKKAAPLASWKKRSIYLVSAVALMVVALVVYQYRSAAPQPEPIETAMQLPIKAAVAPIKLNAFIIPYPNGNFSYISLDISLDIPAGPVRNEMITKLGMIRGRIYESLKRHIQKIEDVPAPDKVKSIVSKAVRSSLSKGDIGDLYLTQFLVI